MCRTPHARFNPPLRSRPWRGQSTRSFDCRLRRRLGCRIVFVIVLLVLVVGCSSLRRLRFLCFCACVACVFPAFGVIFPSIRSIPHDLLIPQKLLLYTNPWFTPHTLYNNPGFTPSNGHSKPRFTPNPRLKPRTAGFNAPYLSPPLVSRPC